MEGYLSPIEHAIQSKILPWKSLDDLAVFIVASNLENIFTPSYTIHRISQELSVSEVIAGMIKTSEALRKKVAHYQLYKYAHPAAIGKIYQKLVEDALADTTPPPIRLQLLRHIEQQYENLRPTTLRAEINQNIRQLSVVYTGHVPEAMRESVPVELRAEPAGELDASNVETEPVSS